MSAPSKIIGGPGISARPPPPPLPTPMTYCLFTNVTCTEVYLPITADLFCISSDVIIFTKHAQATLV